MADKPSWLTLPRRASAVPADLTAVGGLVGLAALAVTAPVVRETPLGAVLGLTLGLFLPGYAVVAALFPATRRAPSAGDRTGGDGAGVAATAAHEPSLRRRGVDGFERAALSVGLSVVVVSVAALALTATPWGVRTVPLVAVVSGATLASAVVATVRRWETSPEERFRAPVGRWLGDARRELLHPETRADALLLVLLAVGIVLALAGVAYAVSAPAQEGRFTAFSLLTETENGNGVPADYPTEFVRGESRPVVVSIANHEHRRTTYTVAVELQRVAESDGETTVLEADELGRLRPTLAPGERWRTTYRVTPTMTGQRLRLVFLLYEGSVPPTPTVDNADQDLRLWVNVTEPAPSDSA